LLVTGGATSQGRCQGQHSQDAGGVLHDGLGPTDEQVGTSFLQNYSSPREPQGEWKGERGGFSSQGVSPAGAILSPRNLGVQEPWSPRDLEPKKTKKPALKRRASYTNCSRERRYADRGHRLPMYSIEPAVEPGVSALAHGWPATLTLAYEMGLAIAHLAKKRGPDLVAPGASLGPPKSIGAPDSSPSRRQATRPQKNLVDLEGSTRWMRRKGTATGPQVGLSGGRAMAS
jgi:hypothetical protein